MQDIVGSRAETPEEPESPEKGWKKKHQVGKTHAGDASSPFIIP